jgi:hypothetical protein
MISLTLAHVSPETLHTIANEAASRLVTGTSNSVRSDVETVIMVHNMMNPSRMIDGTLAPAIAGAYQTSLEQCRKGDFISHAVTMLGLIARQS